MCNIHALLVCLESKLDVRAGLVIGYQFNHSVQLRQFRELLSCRPPPNPQRWLNWSNQMSRYAGLSWSNLPFFRCPPPPSFQPGGIPPWESEAIITDRPGRGGVRVKRVLGSNGRAVCSPGPAGSEVHWDSIRGCGERFHCSLPFRLPDTHTGITANWLCHSRQFLRCEVN